MGVVYLIHFQKPYKHAQHYLGYTDDLGKRFNRHVYGDGSKLLKAVRAAGISFYLVRTWNGVDRKFERKLHNHKKSWMKCPVCRSERGIK